MFGTTPIWSTSAMTAKAYIFNLMAIYQIQTSTNILSWFWLYTLPAVQHNPWLKCWNELRKTNHEGNLSTDKWLVFPFVFFRELGDKHVATLGAGVAL